jgi:hypothetical protein
MKMLEEASSLDWSSLIPVSAVEGACAAQRYLAFAQSDIEDGGSDRHRINAVCNAKRALHLRAETVVEAYGGKSLSKRLANFSNRMTFCDRCGVVAPKILQRLNRMRNAVEHEYYIPETQETSDFVEVVDLFLSATRPLVFKFPGYLEMSSDNVSYFFRIDYQPYSGIINVERVDRATRSTETAKLSFMDEEIYISWVQLIASKTQQALQG